MKSICFPLSGNETPKTLNFAINIITSIKNFDVMVCLHTKNEPVQELLKKHHIKCDVLDIEHKIFPKENFIKNFFISYISSPRIFSYLMENKPSIVHSFDISASIMWNSASRMSGQKIVLSQSTKWDYSYFIKTMASTSDKIISPSKNYAASLPSTSHQKVVIMYPFMKWINDDFNLKEKLNICDNSSMVFAISSSDKSKIVSLGERLNGIFNKKIFLVMNSKKPFELKDSDIEIVGMPYASYPNGADAFIVYDDDCDIYEDVKSAFHYKVPVFAIRNSITLEFIEDGETGFLINSTQPDAIAEKISSLWDLRSQTTEIACKDTPSLLKNYVNELEKIYENL